jgi:hypothetical protein
MKKLVAALLFFVIVCSSSRALCAKTNADIVIVLDQSASMQEYTSRFMADLWISAFAKFFSSGQNVTLVGFSEDVKQHIRIALKDEADLKRLSEHLRKIPTSSLITDFEPPLKYLRKYPRQTDLVVFITDGIPDIWDDKHAYLSKKIRADKRYSKLNSMYARSMKRGATKLRVFKSLKTRYEARNLELIDGHLNTLRGKFGGKIVFLDVSGQHDYLPAWAKKIDAFYVKAIVTDNKISGEQLKKALMELQNISSKVLGQPLPSDLEKQIESLLESKTGHKLSAPAPTADTVQEPESRKNLYVAALLLSVFALSIYLYLRTRRKTGDQRYSPVQLETALVSGPKEEEEKKEEPPDVPVLDDSGYITIVRKQYQAMAYTSPEAARRYIEKQISIADNTGNKEKLRLLRQVLEEMHFDRRIALRIPVPSGAMHVLWKDPSGNLRKSRVINISFNSILFEEPEFTAGEIDAIECIALDLKIIVKRSLKETRENLLHVVILEDFDDNISDRMHWIEILTRIEEV